MNSIKEEDIDLDTALLSGQDHSKSCGAMYRREIKKFLLFCNFAWNGEDHKTIPMEYLTDQRCAKYLLALLQVHGNKPHTKKNFQSAFNDLLRKRGVADIFARKGNWSQSHQILGVRFYSFVFNRDLNFFFAALGNGK
jgi:hypothetical protein